MSSEPPVRKEIRADYVGEYIAYIYGDGHTETDPPGRPLYQEDVQRQRAKEVARSRARAALAAARLRSQEANDIARENSLSALTAPQFEEFRKSQAAVTRLAGTATASGAAIRHVALNADLGGLLVGDDDATLFKGDVNGGLR